MHHAQQIKCIIFQFALLFRATSRDVETRHSGPWPKSLRRYDFDRLRNYFTSLQFIYNQLLNLLWPQSLESRHNGSFIMSPIKLYVKLDIHLFSLDPSKSQLCYNKLIEPISLFHVRFDFLQYVDLCVPFCDLHYSHHNFCQTGSFGRLRDFSFVNSYNYIWMLHMICSISFDIGCLEWDYFWIRSCTCLKVT